MPRHTKSRHKAAPKRTLTRTAPVQVSEQFNALQAGLLVSLKTTLMGNIKYTSKSVEDDHIDDDGARRAIWETTRVVTDPKEHELAVQVRNKAGSIVRGVCAHSAFGLLCPEKRGDKLMAAIREARDLVADFNAKAKCTQVGIYAIVGKVAADDVEAIRAIKSEIRDLLSSMEAGLKNLNVKAVREAANKARSLTAVLSPEAEAKVSRAIESVRRKAREIVKAGDNAAVEIDIQTLRIVRRTRAAFLDMDGAQEIRVPRAAGRTLDMLPAAAAVAAPKPRGRRIAADI